jgi:hypothetical protein
MADTASPAPWHPPARQPAQSRRLACGRGARTVLSANSQLVPPLLLDRDVPRAGAHGRVRRTVAGPHVRRRRHPRPRPRHHRQRRPEHEPPGRAHSASRCWSCSPLRARAWQASTTRGPSRLGRERSRQAACSSCGPVTPRLTAATVRRAPVPGQLGCPPPQDLQRGSRRARARTGGGAFDFESSRLARSAAVRPATTCSWLMGRCSSRISTNARVPAVSPWA